MTKLALDGFAVDPRGVEHQLWLALSRLVCRENLVSPHHPTLEVPCAACKRMAWPLVTPVAKALLAAGKRPNNNYDMVGRGVELLLKLAEAV